MEKYLVVEVSNFSASLLGLFANVSVSMLGLFSNISVSLLNRLGLLLLSLHRHFDLLQHFRVQLNRACEVSKTLHVGNSPLHFLVESHLSP